ncbi:MAG TPA: DNA repair protein RecO [Thermomicrobiaceae bacterium]|nr:DNA repair protein RecO [Thermomicrobiaceae bacterium]
MSGTGGRSRLYRADAVVLRRRDLGEADRILTIYTLERGKLRVVAKGARRPKSRLAGHLEPYSRTALLLAQGRNLDIVTQASLVAPLKQLHQNEASIAYAGYFGDLLDAMTADAVPQPAVFELLLAALQRLDEGRDTQITRLYFELGLLRLLGFRPELRQCIACGNHIEPAVNGFSPEGGVLCAACRAGDPHATPISVNAVKLLRLLDQADLATADGLRLSPELRAEAEQHMRGYLRHLLERELGSVTVLKVLAS